MTAGILVFVNERESSLKKKFGDLETPVKFVKKAGPNLYTDLEELFSSLPWQNKPPVLISTVADFVQLSLEMEGLVAADFSISEQGICQCFAPDLKKLAKLLDQDFSDSFPYYVRKGEKKIGVQCRISQAICALLDSFPKVSYRPTFAAISASILMDDISILTKFLDKQRLITDQNRDFIYILDDIIDEFSPEFYRIRRKVPNFLNLKEDEDQELLLNLRYLRRLCLMNTDLQAYLDHEETLVLP